MARNPFNGLGKNNQQYAFKISYADMKFSFWEVLLDLQEYMMPSSCPWLKLSFALIIGRWVEVNYTMLVWLEIDLDIS